ncbi:transcriptional regulator [Pantoea deleyi]|uniref:winged helix-turn-helix domain-containing protein n=1 Tax=Pantoea deleyi TaxID=470932 RepID=UPI0035D418F8
MNSVYIIGRRVKFVLSEKSLERTSDGHKVKLRSPGSFCLQLLLENHGKMVTHDELCYFGWERFGMAASLSVLHNTIYYLRKMLNETGEFNSNIIETIHRRGFVISLKINVESEKLYSEIIQTVENEKDPVGEYFLKQNNISVDIKTEKEEISHDASGEFTGFSNKTLLIGAEVGSYKFYAESDWLHSNPASNIYEEKKVDVDLAAPSTESYFKRIFHYRKNKICAVVIMAFLLISSVLTGLIALNVFFAKDSSLSSYVYMGKLEKCDVYQNNRAYDFNNLWSADYLRGYCQENRSLYITFYPYTNKLSAINCKNKVSFFSDDICFSNYFIFKNNGFKNV